jgi:hypothetical protein
MGHSTVMNWNGNSSLPEGTSWHRLQIATKVSGLKAGTCQQRIGEYAGSKENSENAAELCKVKAVL